MLRGKDTAARFPLSQADVVALISLVSTIIRALAGSSTMLIGWRMALVALRKTGAAFNEIDQMVSYRLPPIQSHVALWIIFLLSLSP
jgi:hypothetical protein